MDQVLQMHLHSFASVYVSNDIAGLWSHVDEAGIIFFMPTAFSPSLVLPWRFIGNLSNIKVLTKFLLYLAVCGFEVCCSSIHQPAWLHKLKQASISSILLNIKNEGRVSVNGKGQDCSRKKWMTCMAIQTANEALHLLPFIHPQNGKHIDQGI